MTKIVDKSASALFRRFQPRFRKITWHCIGYPLTSDTREGNGQYERLRTFRPSSRHSICYKPAHGKFGPCDGESVEPFGEVYDQRWNSFRDKAPSWPDGFGDKPGELSVDPGVANLHMPPFQYMPSGRDPAKQFELFLANQIVELLLSKLEFFLDIAADHEPNKDASLDVRRFTGTLSTRKKPPKGVEVNKKKILSQPWRFFVPPVSVEGKAIQAAIELEKPGKLEDLKVLERKLTDLLVKAA